MPLTPSRDVSRAAWLVDAAASDDSWRVIELGPPGYEAYARVLHPLDENAGADEEERATQVEGDLDAGVLAALCGVLARHTGAADDCLFCLWEGYGDIHGGGSVAVAVRFDGPRPLQWLRHRLRRWTEPAVPPAFPAWFLDGPKVHVPSREYYLFSGPLDQAGQWGAAELMPGWSREINSPNLFWPGDHAWCVATEIDSAWTGVAGSRALVDELLGDDRFDAVEADREAEQPLYR